MSQWDLVGSPLGTHLKIMTLLSCASFSKLQFYGEGRGAVSPSPLYDDLPPGLVLYRPSAGDHQAFKFIIAKAVSPPEGSIYSSPTLPQHSLNGTIVLFWTEHSQFLSFSPLNC